MKPLRRKGLSLIEIMVAIAILAIVTVAIYMIIFRSARAYTDGSKIGTIAENARRVLDEMANELRIGDKTAILPGGSSSTYIQFRKFVSFDPATSTTTWTTANAAQPDISFLLESSPVDANGNNTADDWRLVRTDLNPSTGATVKTVLCDYVKAGGLTFARSGDNLVITLILEVVDDRKVSTTAGVTKTDSLLTRKLTTSVTLRNK